MIKAFTTLQNPTDEHGRFFADGKRPMICERRCGITCMVRPWSDGRWQWSIYQQAGKRTSTGWKYSQYTRQDQEGFVATFAEGQEIVTRLYDKWMSENK